MMCGPGGDILLPRLLVVVWGLLLYHMLLMLVQVSDAKDLTWYKVKVSQTTLQSNEVLELENVSALRSAAIGSQNQDTHQLFCCTDTGTCRFYDLLVVAGHDDSANGPVDQCWTWHRHPKCQYEGIEYEEGDIIEVNISCNTLQCQSGEMLTYTRTVRNSTPSSVKYWYRSMNQMTVTIPTEPSPANVSLLVNEGCVFIPPTKMYFGDARNFCKGKGGDLYVAGNFNSLQEYLRTFSYIGMWVGGRSRAWLDGRPVETDEWGPDQPNGAPNECIVMFKYQNNFVHLMGDTSCSNYYRVLCEKGVRYN